MSSSSSSSSNKRRSSSSSSSKRKRKSRSRRKRCWSWGCSRTRTFGPYCTAHMWKGLLWIVVLVGAAMLIPGEKWRMIVDPLKAQVSKVTGKEDGGETEGADPGGERQNDPEGNGPAPLEPPRQPDEGIQLRPGL